MVDLEMDIIPNDNNIETPAATESAEENLPRCRLCQGSAACDSRNIFEAEAPKSASSSVDGSTSDEQNVPNNGTGIKYAQYLKDLFNIEFEQHPLLSSLVCDSCWEIVDVFASFRSCIHQSERELQRRLNEIKRTMSNYRPGLNDNPGVFVPEEDCEIIEVDPEMDFLFSDDDFSMQTGSEAEEDNEDDAVVENNTASEHIDAAQFLAPSVSTTLPADENAPTENTRAQAETSLEAAEGNADLQESFLGSGAAASGGATDGHPKNTYLCQFCDLAFTTQSDCHDHELHQHDPVQPYMCNFCQIRLATRPALIYHIREMHDAERPYVCAHCNKGFCRRSDLKKHTIVHTGVRPFTCSVCSKSFSRNTNLTKHMRIHNGIKPYVCQVCPRSFHTEVELLRHSRSHNEVKPYQCSRCPSSFTRKDKLNMHEQVHVRRDAEQLQQNITLANNMASSSVHSVDVSAMIAPSSFTESAEQTLFQSNLLAAQLQQQQQQLLTKATPNIATPTPPPTQTQTKSSTHSSRTHTCDICDKTFQRERDLQRHQALHLDTLFTCKVCGLGFSRREKLARHELDQHAPQYPCDICRITFMRLDELEHHKKMHELQQNAALITQAALNTAQQQNSQPVDNATAQPTPTATTTDLPPPTRPTDADMSFYSNLVPTMNLGFYSETRPEEQQNGI